jgi:hypothetical protein
MLRVCVVQQEPHAGISWAQVRVRLSMAGKATPISMLDRTSSRSLEVISDISAARNVLQVSLIDGTRIRE